VKAWHEGDSGALVRRARFSVGWHPDTWNRNPKDIEDEAHFLLSRDEEERFQRMMAGEQERYLLDFWKRRDPTPETAENEARDRFLERVHFANETYNRFGVEKGMFSDMGRVFIRYGEPNEVFRSVMPGKDNELERLIAQYVSPNDRPVGDIEDKQLGVDMRPFELWIYQGVVAPPPDADPDGRDELQLRKRLLFLFVDERGLGEFRLKYSTE
jgi:GWxTD domain-containing protein